jgi:hypothetical protein
LRLTLGLERHLRLILRRRLWRLIDRALRAEGFSRGLEENTGEFYAGALMGRCYWTHALLPLAVAAGPFLRYKLALGKTQKAAGAPCQS